MGLVGGLGCLFWAMCLKVMKITYNFEDYECQHLFSNFNLPLNIHDSSLKGERTPANYNLCNKAHHGTLNTLISNFSIQPGLFFVKEKEEKIIAVLLLLAQDDQFLEIDV